MGFMIKINIFIKKTINGFFILLIKGYKYIISPILPAACRFYPSCSSYSTEAIRRFGPIKGVFLAIKRILRCNPLTAGGNDPVPDSFHFFK